MMALNIKPLWAWAIANGHKTIETRTWSVTYRGDILIVASVAPDKSMMEYLSKIPPCQIEYGKAIAIARLVECRPMTEADEEAAMCDVYPGAYSWELKNIRRIEPFFVTGQLGLYAISNDHLLRVIE